VNNGGPLNDKHLDAGIVDIEDADFFGIDVPESTVEAQGVQPSVDMPPVLLPPPKHNDTADSLAKQFAALHPDTIPLTINELTTEYNKPGWILELLSRIYLFKHTKESFELGKWCETYSRMRHPEYPQLQFNDVPLMRGELLAMRVRLRHMRMTRPMPKEVHRIMTNLSQAVAAGQDGGSLYLSADLLSGCTISHVNKLMRAVLLRCVCYCCSYLLIWEMGEETLPYERTLDDHRKEIGIYSKILQANPDKMKEFKRI
jgi:hypothetical protein